MNYSATKFFIALRKLATIIYVSWCQKLRHFWDLLITFKSLCICSFLTYYLHHLHAVYCLNLYYCYHKFSSVVQSGDYQVYVDLDNLQERTGSVFWVFEIVYILWQEQNKAKKSRRRNNKKQGLNMANIILEYKT